jgi:hypothetical protein
MRALNTLCRGSRPSLARKIPPSIAIKSHLADALRPLRGVRFKAQCLERGSHASLLFPTWATAEKEPSVNKPRKELRLPPGYQLELDPDMLVLLRSDGSAVAAFSSRGVSLEHVEATAWEEAARGQGGDQPQAPEKPPRQD